MKTLSNIIVLLIATACSVAPVIVTATDSDIECCHEATIIGNRGIDTPEKQMARLRKCLWDHWRNPKFLVLKETAYPKDRAPVLIYYTIDRNDARVWHLTVERRLRHQNDSTGEWETRVDRFDATYVSRIEIPKDDYEPVKEIPESKVCSSEKYWLLLKDADGKTRKI